MKPGRKPMDPWERFARHTRILPNGCIVWTGHCNEDGYGHFWYEGKNWYAHRWAYWYITGIMPVELDHTCSVRNCVVHTAEVSHQENIRRAVYRRSYRVA